ncbi:hypothetical protein [Microbulbifer halophilus]|uniref:Ankyrin repeat domain-containing protein n=1 Tax=Microbulbifer halophilus TaxID=453963 RepID=A0ABW5EAD3_9GAMM|nr:hypothetical protein [Microbulbifer halophilus]MCW8127920.1 hypothetical protein [Microbulbifer halophilus]
MNENELETLCRAVEAGEDDIEAKLGALESRCLVDKRGRTVFDVAIESYNLAAIEYLCQDRQALMFAAPADNALRDPVRHSAAMQGIEYPITGIEQHLADSFGPDLGYNRTPLLTACRLGNGPAMDRLLRAGAKVADRDLLGLTAPELAFYSGGEEGLERFIGACRAAGTKPFSLGQQLLRDLLPFPTLLDALLGIAKPAAPAKKLLFIYHCARLDRSAVGALLADGMDVNKAVTASLNPLAQVCTSQLLWEDDLPDSDYYAYHLKKHWGPAGSHSISVDNSRINEDGSNLHRLMAEAERERRALLARACALSLTQEEQASLMARRCALLDLLLDAGLDLDRARDKLDEDFFDELDEMGLGELNRHLARRGTSAQETEKTGDTEPLDITHWELSGETLLSAALLPLEGAAGLIRIAVSNPYGRIGDATLALRPLDEDGSPTDGWTELLCTGESLDIDGEAVDPHTLDEPVYGEAPWEARYELPLTRDTHVDQLQIRIACDQDQTLNGVLDAWSPKEKA